LVSHNEGETWVEGFENRLLRKTFGPKRDEVTFHSDDESEKSEVGGTCSTYGEMRGAYRALVGRPEGKGPLA